MTREDISPAPVEELQDPTTSTTEILQENLQQRATHDSSPMSWYEKTRSSSEICDDTVDVEHQTKTYTNSNVGKTHANKKEAKLVT